MTKWTFYQSGRAIVPSGIPKYSCVKVDKSYTPPYVPYNPESSLRGAIVNGSLTHKAYGLKEIQSKYQEYMDDKKDPFPLTSIHSSYRPHSYKVGSTRQETVETVNYRMPKKIGVNLGHVINYSSRVPFDSYAKSSRCKDHYLHERYKHANDLALMEQEEQECLPYSDPSWRFSPPLEDKGTKFLTLGQITGGGSLSALPAPAKRSSISQASPHLAIEL